MKCHKCGKCCQKVILPLPQMDSGERFWLNAHKGITVRGNVVIIDSVCEFLTKDNLCSIHENRPKICRESGKKQCRIAHSLDKNNRNGAKA